MIINYLRILACLTIATGLLSCDFPSFGAEPFLRFLDDFDDSEYSNLKRDPYEERIETERHDSTQSTVTVGRGVFQIEGGYSFFYKDQDEEIEKSHTFPEMLLRYGLTEDIEVRLRTNSVWQFVDEEENSDGTEDLRIGLKLGMTEQHSLIPESALELLISVPTGSSTWSTGDTEFGLDFIYGWELSENVTLYGSTGAFQNALGDFGYVPEDTSGDSFVVMSQSAAIGMDMTDRSTMYLEWYGIFSDGREEDIEVGILNAGIDYYLTHNLVVDIRMGTGLTDDSDDLFVGVGGGFRF